MHANPRAAKRSISRARSRAGHLRPLPLLLAALLAMASMTSLGGCYTPKEMSALAASQPDPRQVEAERIWGAILKIVEDEGWPVDVKRREDLMLRTQWLDVEEGVRKRIRFLVVVAPMGVGINVKIKHERHLAADSAPENPWVEIKDDQTAKAQKIEENALVKRIHTLWQSQR